MALFIFGIFIHIFIYKHLCDQIYTTSANTSPYRLYRHLPEYLSSPKHSAPRGEEPRILRTLLFSFLRMLVKVSGNVDPKMKKNEENGILEWSI